MSVLANSTPGFSGMFTDRRPPMQIKFGIGDTVSVTIFEAAAGGLFIPSEAGVRPGNFVQIPNQNVDIRGNISVPYAGTVRAVEIVDACLGRIEAAVLASGGGMLITADHGNAESKIDPRDNSALTAHTTSPVPAILCGTDATALRGGGGLEDVAPTVLTAMGIPVPEVMTGRSLA